MAEIHSKKFNELADNIIEDDVVFIGEATFVQEVAIKGRLSGSIKAKSHLYVDKTAEIEADVTCQGSVYIYGKVKGDIDANERVELFTGSSTIGDVTSSRMVIENDCVFNGHCKMKQPAV